MTVAILAQVFFLRYLNIFAKLIKPQMLSSARSRSPKDRPPLHPLELRRSSCRFLAQELTLPLCSTAGIIYTGNTYAYTYMYIILYGCVFVQTKTHHWTACVTTTTTGTTAGTSTAVFISALVRT